MAGDDDYSESFEGYVPTTVDPGRWMIIGVFIFCSLTTLFLAYLLFRTQRNRKLVEQKTHAALSQALKDVEAQPDDDKDTVGTNSTEDSDDSILTEVEDDNDSVTSTTVPIVDALCSCGGEEAMASDAPVALRKKDRRRFRGGASMLKSFFAGYETESLEKTLEREGKMGIRHGRGVVVVFDQPVETESNRVNSNQARNSEEENTSTSPYQTMDETKTKESNQDSVDAVNTVPVSTTYRRMEEANESVQDPPAASKNEPLPVSFQTSHMETTSGKITTMKQIRRSLKSFGRKLGRVAQYDDETKKIIKLAVPYTMSAVVSCISSVLTVGVLGRLLGSQALAAYFAVYFALSLTTLWLKGALDSMYSLCSQAIGLGETKLAGEYFQIAVLLSQILYIPQMVFWLYYIDDLILWFGFDEATAIMGYNFAVVVLVDQFFGFAFSGLHSFLAVSNHEEFSAKISIIHSTVAFIVILCVALATNPSLQSLGIIWLVLNVIFFVVSIIYIQRQGWFTEYWPGIIGSFAFSNTNAVKHVVNTAVPLSIAHVLSDGEWQILILFASFLGPAEVIAFGIFGELWDSIETITEAIGDAGEVRVAHLLGADKPMRAKQSAQKSMVLGFIEGLVAVLFLVVFGSFLPGWMTGDPTLQVMLSELLPLLCIGILFGSIGSISFALVGAQGCFGLSTAIYFIGSWLVTLPLALLFSKAFNFNLEGLVAAVVIGNTLSGMANTFLLLDSDWYYFAALTKQRNKVGMEY